MATRPPFHLTTSADLHSQKRYPTETDREHKEPRFLHRPSILLPPGDCPKFDQTGQVVRLICDNDLQFLEKRALNRRKSVLCR